MLNIIDLGHREFLRVLGATLSGTKIASQNRSDHGGCKWARNHSAAEIARVFRFGGRNKKTLAASDFWVTLKIAGSSQRPWLQVAAAARFCGRSDYGTLRRYPRKVPIGILGK